MNYPEASKERTRRPKEFLWLNLVYKNLHFSKRALQNIIDLQIRHDVFPSLPDALATLNNSSVESLLYGGAIPSRSVVRYTQPLAHHLRAISGNTVFPRTAGSFSGCPSPAPGILTPSC